MGFFFAFALGDLALDLVGCFFSSLYDDSSSSELELELELLEVFGFCCVDRFLTGRQSLLSSLCDERLMLSPCRAGASWDCFTSIISTSPLALLLPASLSVSSIDSLPSSWMSWTCTSLLDSDDVVCTDSSPSDRGLASSKLRYSSRASWSCREISRTRPFFLRAFPMRDTFSADFLAESVLQWRARSDWSVFDVEDVILCFLGDDLELMDRSALWLDDGVSEWRLC